MSTCNQKRLLFLHATKDYYPEIIAHIKGVCSLLGVEFVEHTANDLESFKTFCAYSKKFDFLYIAAHGDHRCFGENQPLNTFRWADFGLCLCETQIMNSGSVLFLGCCHGGLKKVALILFCNCPTIVSVCGPRWKVSVHEVAVAIHTFLYNLLISQEEPLIAADRTSAAIGFSFPLYDRYDLEADIRIMQSHEWLDCTSDYSPTQAAVEVIDADTK